jgi:glycosyltransferase involved in cell wall biosynthesis
LSTAIETFTNTKVEIIPVNELHHEDRHYNDNIYLTIDSQDENSYVEAAKYINDSPAIALSLQHEYGLYGGEQGEYILKLLELVKKPIITTCHTILFEPNAKQREVLHKIADKSDKIIVMANAAINILVNIYSVPKEKIVMIPHGVLDVPFEDQTKAKEKLGLTDSLVVSTFGLLGPGKGLEYVVLALPEVIKQHPKAKYLILGRTHPEITKRTGEEYRNSLIAKIESLGLTENVRLENRFLSDDDVTLYLQASDIYITPYLDPQQITSGTLARAISIGRTCVSTSYPYAEELVDDTRGKIVPFRDSTAIAEAVLSLLSDDQKRQKIEKLNYDYSRPMTWKNVARNYVDLLQKLTCQKSDAEANTATKSLTL